MHTWRLIIGGPVSRLDQDRIAQEWEPRIVDVIPASLRVVARSSDGMREPQPVVAPHHIHDSAIKRVQCAATGIGRILIGILCGRDIDGCRLDHGATGQIPDRLKTKRVLVLS